MKNFKIIFFALALGMSSYAIISCGDSAENSENTEQMGKEYTSTYLCPMHCEGSGSDKIGTCPVCGMDYVMNEEHQADGHSH